jgi:uncharacterized protein YdaU (DUF1376 family)
MGQIWMPLYIGDFLADTMDFDDRKTGIYIRLIMHCWQHGYIPADHEQLRLIAHASARAWRKHCNILDFFERTVYQQRPCYVHGRVTKERQRFAEISNKRKAAALQMHMQKHMPLPLRKKDTTTSLPLDTARAKPDDQPLKISEELLMLEKQKRPWQ